MKVPRRKEEESVRRDNSILETQVCLVSVLVVTFQHVKFIQECLENILKQKDCKFKVLIGDDGSDDGTLEKVRIYKDKYPEIIHLYEYDGTPKVKFEGRVTGHRNFMRLFERVDTKYYAICEGDDYWTDPFKLKKQISFLESNPDYNICFHPVLKLFENSKQKSMITNSNTKEDASFEDFLPNNFIHTVSTLYRRAAHPQILPGWYERVAVGDWALNLLAARGGKVKMLRDNMAVYRVHSGGNWSSRTKDKRYSYYVLGLSLWRMKEDFNSEQRELIRKTAAEMFYRLLHLNLTKEDKLYFIESILMFYRTAWNRSFKQLLSPLKWSLRGFLKHS